MHKVTLTYKVHVDSSATVLKALRSRLVQIQYSSLYDHLSDVLFFYTSTPATANVTCTGPNGRRYRPGETYTADDGCNTW